MADLSTLTGIEAYKANKRRVAEVRRAFRDAACVAAANPHRCAGLPEGVRAYVTALPQGERVQVYYDTADGMDCLARAFPYCPQCGASASFLIALTREPAVTR